ncbi:ZN292 protein, partial [Amia calva]|nr:ZN292 protein [Amia calva]
MALCYFTKGTASFSADCEHVQYALSSLALSFFELLLFFGKDEFLEDPLKDILDSFQVSRPHSMAEIDGTDAVEIICNTESEERDDFLLALCKAFLVQQLQSGDMFCIWDLIFIWSRLQLRANPSRQDFLEECQQLILTVTNVKMIFPFMKVIKTELGPEGLQFCVELCACALQMDLHHDPVTKALVYKVIAYLLPNDLEVCRACALLVFFLERTLESYKAVYLLYTHPDQEYHVDSSLIRNHIRFELLQILKKGLFFDPEFWNLITLKTNCLSLMSDKVKRAALKETEDKWMPNALVRETTRVSSDLPDSPAEPLKSPGADWSTAPSQRCVRPPEASKEVPVKRRGRKPGKRSKVIDKSALRRSLRQLDMVQENTNKQLDTRQQRHLVRQTEGKTHKLHVRKPDWFLPESTHLVENSAPRKRVGRPRKKMQPCLPDVKLPELPTAEPDKAQDLPLEEPKSDSSSRALTRPPPVLVEPVPSPEQASPLQAIPLPYHPLRPPVPEPVVEAPVLVEEPVEMPEVVAPLEPLAALGDAATPPGTPAEDGPAEDAPAVPAWGESEIATGPTEDLAMEGDSVLAPEATKQPDAEQQPDAVGGDTTTAKPDSLPSGPVESAVFTDSIQSPVKAPEENAELPPAQQDQIPECTVLEPQGLTDKLPEGPVVARDKSPQGLVIELDTALEAHVAELDCTPEATVVEPGGVTRQTLRIEETGGIAVEASKPDGAVKEAAAPPEQEQAQQPQPHPAPNEIAASETPAKRHLRNTLARTENALAKLRCVLCNKDCTSGHIMRHATVHMQKGDLSCVLCGKKFKNQRLTLNHLKEHIKKLKRKNNTPAVRENDRSAPTENGTAETPGHNAEPPPAPPNHEQVAPENHIENHASGPAPPDRLSATPKALEKQERNKPSKKDPSIVQRANGSVSKPSPQREFGCPAESCTRAFVREWALVKHVKAAHPSDLRVQEFVFARIKGRCLYCQRRFQSFQHYLDHVKRHDDALKYFCCHYNCAGRFKTHAELAQHTKSHPQFQAQCSSPDCFALFTDMSILHDHECLHYPPTVTTMADASAHLTSVGGGPAKRKRKKDAPEQTPVSALKIRRKKSAETKTYTPGVGGKASEKETGDGAPEAGSVGQAVGASGDGSVSDGQLLNGHTEVEEGGEGTAGSTKAAAAEASEPQVAAADGPAKELDTGDARDTAADKAAKDQPDKAPASTEGALLTPKKSRKLPDELSPYGGTSKKPFVRPPPSAYLDEQYISMPKRRKSPAKTDSPVPHQAEPSTGGPRRCTKCFVLFSKVEELQSHLAQKKCQALFGFDSDEESK